MRLVDSHCHLNAEPFAHDAAEVLAAAELAGLERILVPGWDVASCGRALALAARLPQILVGVGVHPHAAAEVDDGGWAQIVAMAADPMVAAIGETGLDFDRMWSPADAQLANLRRNLALALATGKPAILHCRSKVGSVMPRTPCWPKCGRPASAGRRAATRSGRGRPRSSTRFRGRSTTSRRPWSWDALSACRGSRSAGEEATAQAVRKVAAERLLVETDAPYLSPPGAPRRRNEPRYVETTARWVAEQRGEHPDALGAALVAAFDATFRRAG